MHILRLLKSIVKSNSDLYQLIDDIRSGLISRASMVLHLGAHVGDESSFYNSLGKDVIWIEANPAIYTQLQLNISQYTQQRAICALLGDTNQSNIDFHVASNDGQSSSIFQFGSQMNHDGLSMVDVLKLKMKRLDSLLTDTEIYTGSHWIVDVQGAELQVLAGSGKLIDKVYSMQVEVSTKEEYLGGTKFEELNQFLNSKGLYPLWLPKLNSHEDLFFLRRTH